MGQADRPRGVVQEAREPHVPPRGGVDGRIDDLQRPQLVGAAVAREEDGGPAGRAELSHHVVPVRDQHRREPPHSGDTLHGRLRRPDRAEGGG